MLGLCFSGTTSLVRPLLCNAELALGCEITSLLKALLALCGSMFGGGHNAAPLVLHQMFAGQTTSGVVGSSVPHLRARTTSHFVIFSTCVIHIIYYANIKTIDERLLNLPRRSDLFDYYFSGGNACIICDSSKASTRFVFRPRNAFRIQHLLAELRVIPTSHHFRILHFLTILFFTKFQNIEHGRHSVIE